MFRESCTGGGFKSDVHRRGEFSVELSWFCRFVNALTILARRPCSDRHKNTTPHKEKRDLEDAIVEAVAKNQDDAFLKQSFAWMTFR